MSVWDKECFMTMDIIWGYECVQRLKRIPLRLIDLSYKKTRFILVDRTNETM